MDTQPGSTRNQRFIKDVVEHTPILRMSLLLTGLWIIFSFALYVSEMEVEGSSITSYSRALYWSIAAFSTAGIADMPQGEWSILIGGVWIVLGSLLYFGAIVAIVTAYFMRPMQRPFRQIIDTIEFNLERLDDLTLDELELLKETTDVLIEEVEKLKVGGNFNEA